MRKLAAITALTVLLSGAFSAVAPLPAHAAGNAKGKIRILVLPFATPRNTPELDKYATGTMDTLIMALKHVPSFIMIDRSDIEDQIKRQAQQMTGIANDKNAGVKLGGIMGAQVLMAGSMQKAAKTVRITANIIDIESSVINQSEKVTGELQKLFDLQLQLAQLFAKDVKIEFTVEQLNAVQTVVKSTNNIEAYDFYTQGRTAYLSFTVAGYQKATELFQKALDLDSKYALAYAGLGQSFASWAIQVEKQGNDPRPYFEKALANALKAKELAPNIAEPYLALAFTYNALIGTDMVEDLPSKLEATVDKLLQLDPNSAEGYVMKATLFKESDPQRLKWLQDAVRLNPNLVAAQTNIARTYEVQGQTDKALGHYRRALELSPKDPVARTNLGQLYYKQGKIPQAVKEWQTALQHDPHHTIALLKLGMAAEKQGDLQKAIGFYKQASEVASAMTPQRLAIFIQLGDAYRKAKDYPDATSTYELVIRNDPKAEDALVGLGIIEWESGSHDAAIARWKRVLEINPENDRARRLLEQAKAK